MVLGKIENVVKGSGITNMWSWYRYLLKYV